MTSFVVKNNVESLVTNNPLAQAATTLNVTASEGANFPSTFPFVITIWDEDAFPDPGDDSGMEIVKCTARATDALTIVRAQEGTGDVAHALGERVAMLITAGILNDATYGLATKLDGIESAATADQTNTEIRDAVEAATDSNTFKDADHTKLNGIETGATKYPDTGEQAFLDADHTKLNGIESAATADQTNAEIKTAYEANANSNEFSDTEQTKLSGLYQPFATKSDVTASRAVDGTVYRNTSGKTMMVTVSIDFQYGNNSYECVAKTDAATPPTEIVAHLESVESAAGNVVIPITFLVFDDDYYLVDGTLDTNNAVLSRWIEWT